MLFNIYSKNYALNYPQISLGLVGFFIIIIISNNSILIICSLSLLITNAAFIRSKLQ